MYKLILIVLISLASFNMIYADEKEFENFQKQMRACIDEEHIPAKTIHDAWVVLISFAKNKGEMCFQACVYLKHNMIVDHKFHADNLIDLIAQHFEEQKLFKFTKEQHDIIVKIIDNCRGPLTEKTYTDDCELANDINKCHLVEFGKVGVEPHDFTDLL